MTLSRMHSETEASIIDMSLLKEDSELIVHNSSDEAVNDLDRAHVWFCNLDRLQFSPDWLSLLSGRERGRAGRLKSSLEWQRFLARYAFARHILARIVGQPPEALKFLSDESGKPRLASPTSTKWANSEKSLNFNLSHSENLLGLAVAFGREVGIDLELVETDVDTLALAATHLPFENFSLIRGAAPSERDVTFYRLWARKEALAKMKGTGIASQQVIEPPTVSQWKVHSFEFTHGEKVIVGAVALEDPSLEPARP